MSRGPGRAQQRRPSPTRPRPPQRTTADRPTWRWPVRTTGSTCSSFVVIVELVNMNEGGRAVRMDGGPCDLRCCMGDGGWLALQSRLAEEGSKPRQWALAEDRRLERCRKGAT